MSVARVTEITSQSPESFDHAIKNGVARATKTLKNVQTAWIKDQSVVVDGSSVSQFRVTMKVTFILED